jgi:hypothetical protein
MDDIIEIARIMRHRSCAKTLAGTCKEMLGTAVSVGCTVDGKDPRDVQEEVGHCHCEFTGSVLSQFFFMSRQAQVN